MNDFAGGEKFSFLANKIARCGKFLTPAEKSLLIVINSYRDNNLNDDPNASIWVYKKTIELGQKNAGDPYDFGLGLRRSYINKIIKTLEKKGVLRVIENKQNEAFKCTIDYSVFPIRPAHGVLITNGGINCNKLLTESQPLLTESQPLLTESQRLLTEETREKLKEKLKEKNSQSEHTLPLCVVAPPINPSLIEERDHHLEEDLNHSSTPIVNQPETQDKQNTDREIDNADNQLLNNVKDLDNKPGNTGGRTSRTPQEIIVRCNDIGCDAGLLPGTRGTNTRKNIRASQKTSRILDQRRDIHLSKEYVIKENQMTQISLILKEALKKLDINLPSERLISKCLGLLANEGHIINKTIISDLCIALRRKPMIIETPEENFTFLFKLIEIDGKETFNLNKIIKDYKEKQAPVVIPICFNNWCGSGLNGIKPHQFKAVIGTLLTSKGVERFMELGGDDPIGLFNELIVKRKAGACEQLHPYCHSPQWLFQEAKDGLFNFEKILNGDFDNRPRSNINLNFCDSDATAIHPAQF